MNGKKIKTRTQEVEELIGLIEEAITKTERALLL